MLNGIVAAAVEDMAGEREDCVEGTVVFGFEHAPYAFVDEETVESVGVGG